MLGARNLVFAKPRVTVLAAMTFNIATVGVADLLLVERAKIPRKDGFDLLF